MLAEGLSEDLTTGLAPFAFLNVIGGSTTPDSRDDLKQMAAGLAVRYLLHGRIRRVGPTVRLNAHLLDASTGARLWSQTFDRNLEDATLFEMQDELTDRIVGIVADGAGVLARSMANTIRDRPVDELTADEWVFRAFAHMQQLKPEEHSLLRGGLEGVTARHPYRADGWGWLSMLYLQEFQHQLNPRPNSLERALDAARKSVELDPACQVGRVHLASVYFHQRDLGAFLPSAERAIALNPRDTHFVGVMGMMIAFTGEWDRGLEIVRKAMELNPHHPGWLHFVPFYVHFQRGEYEAALQVANLIQMPDFQWTWYVIGAATGQLGRTTEAREAVERLKELGIETLEQARTEEAKWIFEDQLLDHLLDGLRKAGLNGDSERAAAEPTLLEPGLAQPPATQLSDAIAPPISDTTLRSRRSTFVAREAERSRLDQMLEEAVDGRGGLVLLGGEPGVGKTRLATEILEDGRDLGMLPLAGHAYEGETIPFVTASEILEEMVRLVPESSLRQMLGDTASELSRLLPELRQKFSDISEPADMPPELQQRHLFKSVLEFLTRACAKQPMVVLLDDLHWADESSLSLLEHMAPRLAELPILMVGTYRDVEADIGPAFAKATATLVRQRLAERIKIDLFDETSVADILAALGGSNPPAELVRAIHQATEGNVFFIEETFRHLTEEGLLFNDEGRWQTELDVELLDVPEGVRLVTARRLEHLTESTQKILSMASVIGLRFPIRVLEAASPDREAVLAAIEEAEAAQLLQPTTGGRELRYEFVHALARQTLLGDLSPLRRQRMHLTIADAIEQAASDWPERRAMDLAHHLVEAGASADPDRTVRWLTAAGESAAAATAMEEAVHYFGTAFSLTDDEPTQVRADLLHRRGSARLSLGHREDFVADLAAAFDAFESLGLGEQAAAVVAEVSYMLIWNAQPDEAKSFIAKALPLVGDEKSAAHCRLLSAQGLVAGMGSEPVDAERAHAAAVEMARALDDPALLAEALQNQSIDGWFRLDGLQLERAGHEAAAIRRDLHQEWNLGHCLWMEQAGLVWQGRYDEAERINEELHPLAERHEDVGSLAISAMMNCLLEQARGNLEASSHHMRRSVDFFNAGNFPWGWISEGHYSVNALLVGELDKARTAFELAGENAIPGIVWSGADTCYQLSGKARLGDPDTFSIFESLRSQIPELGVGLPSGLAMLLMGAIEALVLSGKNEEAAKLYPAIRDFVDLGISVQSFTYGLHQRFAGMAATAARDWVEAEEHFQKALRLAEDLPHKVDQARVRYWYARMLLARDAEGDQGSALKILAEARALSESMRMQGLIEWIDELVGDQAAPTTEPSNGLDPLVVAVLPFDNLSGAAEAEFLATGLHSDLVTELSRVDGLTIISRSSMMRYQDTDKTVREIGRELNAGTLIEGTVQSIGNRVRLTAQLTDASDDAQRWAERYDRELSTETLFDLQTEVTRKIVDSLQTELASTLEIPRGKPQTLDMEAYKLCTLGRVQVERRTKAGCLRAIEHFENAVERDPEYAPAWAGLAEALAIAVWYGYVDPGDRLERAGEAASRAVELDPESAEAHCALATSLGAIRKGPEALEELKLAVRLQPSYWDAHNRLSYLHKLHGRKSESLASAERAVEINPLSAEAVSNLSLSLSTNVHPERALPEAQRAGELSPGWTTAPFYEALARYQLGNYAEAVELLTGLTVEWAGLGAQATLAICYLALGDGSSARQVHATMDPEIDAFATGLVHLALGEIDSAFERFFENEYLNDWACLAIHHFHHDIWQSVENDPRYDELVRRAYENHDLDPSNPL